MPLPHGAVALDDRVRRVLLGAFALGLAVSISLAQLVLTLLAARLVWRLATRRARLHGWPLGVPVAAWAATSLLSALLAGRPLDAATTAVRGLVLIVALYAVLDALPDAAAADRWLHGLLALIAALGVIGVLQVALCPVLDPLAPWAAGMGPLRRVLTGCRRAHAFYSIYMTLAGVLSLVLLAVLPRLLPGGGGAGGAGGRWAAAWLAGGTGLAMTYVRGAWLGFLAGALVLLGLVRQGRALLVVAVAILVVLVLAVPGVRRRAESIVDPADPTARERLAMWRSGGAMARDHLLLGVGPGQVKRVYPDYVAPEYRAKPRGHLHNTPLQILVERGALGLAAWAGLFGLFFWRAARVLRRLPSPAARERALVAGSIAAIAGFLAGGLTEYNFGDSEVVLVAWTVMAVPFVVSRATPTGAAPVAP
ncbi:MAG: O-antigen ligase family protein [Candidatus Rokuibacteriota bacterium]